MNKCILCNGSSNCTKQIPLTGGAFGIVIICCSCIQDIIFHSNDNNKNITEEIIKEINENENLRDKTS